MTYMRFESTAPNQWTAFSGGTPVARITRSNGKCSVAAERPLASDEVYVLATNVQELEAGRRGN